MIWEYAAEPRGKNLLLMFKTIISSRIWDQAAISNYS